jgi:hypothetical protein
MGKKFFDSTIETQRRCYEKPQTYTLLIATLVGGTATAANSPIAGTWQGKTGDVPAVTLTVKDEGGKLSGSAVFYKILDDGSGPKVAGKDTSALINAKFEGKIFSFEVKGFRW